MTTSLRQQAIAIDTARKILKGARIKPRGAEMEFLDAQLVDAIRTTEHFAENEADIRSLLLAKSRRRA